MAKKKSKKLTKQALTKQRFKKYMRVGQGVVLVPSAPAVSHRAEFNANPTALRNVCRSDEVKDTCYVGQKKYGAKKLGLEKGDTLGDYKKACTRVGGKMKKGYKKPIRAGKVELDFLSPAQAAKLKTLPGPNMRLCLRDDERGYIVPVSGPEAAAQLERAFVKCTKGNKKKMPACALKLAEQQPHPVRLGGLLGGLF